MRRFFLMLPALVATACMNTTAPERVPIDCETLASSLPASDASLTMTADSLKYRDVTVGTGATVATGSIIAFHYSACLAPAGTKFDENTNTDPAAVLQVGNANTIAGFNEGVVGMKAGGRRQLVVPPQLAWGAAGAKDVNGNVVVPPNSTVVFTVDVFSVQ